MVLRSAGAVLLLLLLPASAVEIAKKQTAKEATAIEETADRPLKIFKTVPLAPFGEPEDKVHPPLKASRGPAPEDSNDHSNSNDRSMYHTVQGGPPISKQGTAFDVSLMSQVPAEEGYGVAPAPGKLAEKEGNERTQSLLAMKLDMDSNDHSTSNDRSMYHTVQGGPPINKQGKTFDVSLKSQV